MRIKKEDKNNYNIKVSERELKHINKELQKLDIDLLEKINNNEVLEYDVEKITIPPLAVSVISPFFE